MASLLLLKVITQRRESVFVHRKDGAFLIPAFSIISTTPIPGFAALLQALTSDPTLLAVQL